MVGYCSVDVFSGVIMCFCNEAGFDMKPFQYSSFTHVKVFLFSVQNFIRSIVVSTLATAERLIVKRREILWCSCLFVPYVGLHCHNLNTFIYLFIFWPISHISFFFKCIHHGHLILPFILTIQTNTACWELEIDCQVLGNATKNQCITNNKKDEFSFHFY